MMLVAVAAFALLAGACSIDVARNDDGSLQVETVLTEDSLADELAKGVDDPQVNFVTVDMKDGFALVEMERTRDSGVGVDDVSFRVDLSVDDDHLAVDVTNATWNGIPIPQDLVDLWNDELAAQIEADAKADPDSTLVSVSLTETAMTMEFHVETDQSKS